MKRKDFKLNEPFREINKHDLSKEFKSDFLIDMGISLKSLFEENKNDKYVWVYDFDGKILAVLSFLDVGSYFYMDIVARNDLFGELCKETKPGYSLFTTLEDMSRIFGYSIIRLNSVESRIEYWKRSGYDLSGTPKNNNGRMLYPMEKKL